MSQHSGNVKKKPSDYAQTEWGTIKLNKSIPELGPGYDFLKDPNSRKKLAKIRKELQMTMRRVKRKKADRRTINTFLLVNNLFLLALVFNMNYFPFITGGIALIISGLLSFYLYNRVVTPIGKDLDYFKTKEDFLQSKMNEVTDSLRGSGDFTNAKNESDLMNVEKNISPQNKELEV